MTIKDLHILIIGGFGGFTNAIFYNSVILPFIERRNNRFHIEFNIFRNIFLGIIAGYITYVVIGTEIQNISKILLLSFTGGFCFETVFFQLQYRFQREAIENYTKDLLDQNKYNIS